MQNKDKWDRREFLKLTSTAALGVLAGSLPLAASCQRQGSAWTAPVPESALKKLFQHPPTSAKPWTFWYWMQASVSKEGLTADLEAMRAVGIGGAYLMPIKGATNPPLMDPPVEQLTPEWWEMVRHSLKEAERLGLQIAMHVSDGFALAGGPWITPALSMQKVVWTETLVKGGRTIQQTLPQPETVENYYQDIAVLAFPTPPGSGLSTHTLIPKITTGKPEVNAGFLVQPGTKETFRSDEPTWIQYAFTQPFTCRSIVIRTNGNNYQAHRLLLEVSNDDQNFRSLGRLKPPRHGWQDTDANYTHVIEPTTAKYFRFTFDKAGSEPGAEDLDSAKWKPSLKIHNLELSGAPRLHQYEGKTGAVWRVSNRTTARQVPNNLCVPLNKIVNITKHLDAQGNLTWQAPAGSWTILRLGHTSTGHTNATAGAGKGLECDKFNPEAIKTQFNGWFGEAIRQAGPELAAKVLKIFHVDSWECGSQNWSKNFPAEFEQRRGYDLAPYLPAMAGIPVQTAAISEKFLHDIRQTSAELVVDKFYGTLQELAHEKGCVFSAESVAPTMLSDGLRHYDLVDIPMGEFWLNSPTHDKPNDMLDAISGAHIYGKPIVQAEAFTTVRMAWDEHPAILKAIGDRNYALGINRMVYHVFTHNPWPDRKPGMTLDGVGLYFQRDQTWWKPGRAWVEYAQRCQALLQQGNPVVDIAVFSGEETPRRSLLPDRLVASLPGIFGEEIVAREKQRLVNDGEPQRQKPAGVTHSANMADPENWVNPLRGYAYDTLNPDALLRLAQVRNGRIELPGGASYGLLILPAPHALAPDSRFMSPEVLTKLHQLVKEGATILVHDKREFAPGLQNTQASDQQVQKLTDELWRGEVTEAPEGGTTNLSLWRVGQGRVIRGPYKAKNFEPIGLEPDLIVQEDNGQSAADVAWTHRTAPGADIYFISNQQNTRRTLRLSLRAAGRLPELYNPVTGETRQASDWHLEKGRTILPVRLEANESIFVVLQEATTQQKGNGGNNWHEPQTVQTLTENYEVAFDPAFGGPEKPINLQKLEDWTKNAEFNIRHYSGTATYTQTFNWKAPANKKSRVWLDLGQVENIAEVTLNGKSCGVAWTAPYRVEISEALKSGKNQLQIEVSNTWANRLIGDHTLPEEKRITRTTAPFRLEGNSLLPAGLLGPVKLMV